MTVTIVAEAKIQINANAFLQGYANKISQRMDKIAQLGVETIQRTLRQSNSRGLDPAPPGSPPRRGNSTLIGAMYWKEVSPFVREIGASEAAPHARIQELGGTISGQNMPIPISDKAKRWRAMGNSASSFPGKLVPIRASNGKMLLIQKKRTGKNAGKFAGAGKGGQNWEIHYLLSNKVVLQERPYLRPLLRDSYFLTRARNIMAKG